MAALGWLQNLDFAASGADAPEPEPEPEPSGGGGGAGEVGKAGGGRRRREVAARESAARANYGPVFDAPAPEGAPAQPASAPDVSDERLAELESLRAALAADESRVVALGRSLEQVEAEIARVLEARAELENAALLLLLME